MSQVQEQQVIVDNKWVLDHLKDERVRIVEVDYDPNTANNVRHIPG
ncbi:MAG: sulfurtransferase, partial [Saccharolobus sp.]